MTGIIASLIPPAALLLAWFSFRNAAHRNMIMIAVWLEILILLAALGALAWRDSHECSRLAATLLPSSLVWLSGPLLIWTIGKKFHPALSIAGAIALPWLSGMGCFFLMAFTDQIWGM